MTKHNAHKQRARALQAELGIGYHQALTLSRGGNTPTPAVVLERRRPHYPGWSVLVPGERPRTADLDYRDPDTELDRVLDEIGRQALGPLPAGELPDRLTVPVRRTTPGQRLAERHRLTEEIYVRAGRGHHTIHDAYATAVTDALERAGLPVTDSWSDDGEPRQIVITLTLTPAADPDEGDGEQLLILWDDEGAWQYAAMRPDGSNNHPEPLGAGPLDLPEQVAEAVRIHLRRDPVLPLPEPDWHPPADYAPGSRPYDLSADDPDPAFERSLAAYLTHPAWTSALSAARGATPGSSG
ncbi:DUF6292 family protein [Streptomyces erythrochromogenes]|uniref:DUF6292 family protein n=1 Tax=Streptomyces erythrochromogenes TaxID=285574 RepID=UPI00343B52BF